MKRMKNAVVRIVAIVKNIKTAPFSAISLIADCLTIIIGGLMVLICIHEMKMGGLLYTNELFTLTPISIYFKPLVLYILMIVVAVTFRIIGGKKEKSEIGNGEWVISGLLVFIVLPALCLLITNVKFIILALVGAIVVGFFLPALLSGSNDVPAVDYSNVSKDRHAEKSTKHDENKPRVWKINRDARLIVEDNSHGARVIRAYGQRLFGSGEYDDLIHYGLVDTVTLEEFINGRVIIEVEGKKMTEKDLIYK